MTKTTVVERLMVELSVDAYSVATSTLTTAQADGVPVTPIVAAVVVLIVVVAVVALVLKNRGEERDPDDPAVRAEPRKKDESVVPTKDLLEDRPELDEQPDEKDYEDMSLAEIKKAKSAKVRSGDRKRKTAKEATEEARGEKKDDEKKDDEPEEPDLEEPEEADEEPAQEELEEREVAEEEAADVEVGEEPAEVDEEEISDDEPAEVDEEELEDQEAADVEADEEREAVSESPEEVEEPDEELDETADADSSPLPGPVGDDEKPDDEDQSAGGLGEESSISLPTPSKKSDDESEEEVDDDTSSGLELPKPSGRDKKKEQPEADDGETGPAMPTPSAETGEAQADLEEPVEEAEEPVEEAEEPVEEAEEPAEEVEEPVEEQADEEVVDEEIAGEPAAEELEEDQEEVEDEKAGDEEPKSLEKGLEKTRTGFIDRLGSLFDQGGELDEELVEDVEEVLFTADIGTKIAQKILETVEDQLSAEQKKDPIEVWSFIRAYCEEILRDHEGGIDYDADKPFVLLVAGVNGVGKTTTIGKIGDKLKRRDKDVLFVAGDTFRAGAVDQLDIWARRTDIPMHSGEEGADPASVIYEGIERGLEDETDVVICDTAGRLHTDKNLLEELSKMERVAGKALDGAPHETVLVLDANTGQNAIAQAKKFDGALDISGVILTKLDGTAKGGVILGICDELDVPVHYIGIGEGLRDLREFDAEEFVEALFM